MFYVFFLLKEIRTINNKQLKSSQIMTIHFAKFLVILTIILPKFNGNLEKNFYSPSKLSDCSAKLDNGKIIDLTSLDNKASPR